MEERTSRTNVLHSLAGLGDCGGGAVDVGTLSTEVDVSRYVGKGYTPRNPLWRYAKVGALRSCRVGAVMSYLEITVVRDKCCVFHGVRDAKSRVETQHNGDQRLVLVYLGTGA